jgi:transcription elongation factor Elf1
MLRNIIKIEVANTTAIYCPKCGSIGVVHSTPEVHKNGKYHDEIYAVECKSCGCTGSITESWIIDKSEGDDD